MSLPSRRRPARTIAEIGTDGPSVSVSADTAKSGLLSVCLVPFGSAMITRGDARGPRPRSQQGTCLNPGLNAPLAPRRVPGTAEAELSASLICAIYRTSSSSFSRPSLWCQSWR